MIIDWAGFKTLVDAQTLVILYQQDKCYINQSNHSLDKDAYFLETTYNGTIFYCNIEIGTPASADETDFVNNYKTAAIPI